LSIFAYAFKALIPFALQTNLSRKNGEQPKMSGLKKLAQVALRKGGRNHHGIITVRHRGGGCRRLYKIVDFKRTLFDVPGIVRKIEYDPNRTSKIALICYERGIFAYMLSPQNLELGDIIRAGATAEIAVGNALPIGRLPIGSILHNIELKPGAGGKYVRSAGTRAKSIKKDKNSSILKLNPGVSYSVPSRSLATIGAVRRKDIGTMSGETLRKAGQSR